jgi:hypothetical protein
MLSYIDPDQAGLGYRGSLAESLATVAFTTENCFEPLKIGLCRRCCGGGGHYASGGTFPGKFRDISGNLRCAGRLRRSAKLATNPGRTCLVGRRLPAAPCWHTMTATAAWRAVTFAASSSRLCILCGDPLSSRTNLIQPAPQSVSPWATIASALAFTANWALYPWVKPSRLFVIRRSASMKLRCIVLGDVPGRVFGWSAISSPRGSRLRSRSSRRSAASAARPQPSTVQSRGPSDGDAAPARTTQTDRRLPLAKVREVAETEPAQCYRRHAIQPRQAAEAGENSNRGTTQSLPDLPRRAGDDTVNFWAICG